MKQNLIQQYITEAMEILHKINYQTSALFLNYYLHLLIFQKNRV